MKADLSVGEKILKEISMPNRLLCYESMSQIYKAVTLAYLLGRADMTLIKSNKKTFNTTLAMNSYKTKNGVDVWVTRTYDCEQNLGGFYCQIYLDKDLERELDYFVIPAEVVNDNKEEEYILEFISNYWAEVTYECCPHCGNEVVLLAEYKAQICPNCKSWIAPCSLCKDCKGICTIAQECKKLNGSKITPKELPREQWDLLGKLVLNEMTKLREFGNERGGMVRDLLTTEIGKLQTLYNFLID